MNDLQIFSNPEFGEIRTSSMNGEVWFCLADVCRPLGIKSHHCKERLKSDGIVFTEVIDSIGRPAKMLFVNEGNLYRTIFQSNKPEAEKFTDWVTDEVLPALRKSGTYSLAPVTPAQLALQQAQLLVDMESRLNVVENLMLDVGAKAEQAIAKAEKAVMVYAQPDKDHWTEDMAASIAQLASIIGWPDAKLRGSLYSELEHTAGHTNIDTRLSRLRERMKKTGMRYRDAKALNKLDAVAADGKLRAIFEGIVRGRLARAEAEPSAIG